MIKSELKHYRTDNETIIAMSGGRTSAFMLHQTLLAYNYKLPDHIKVCFNNTGKEMPQTLDFVNQISKRWNVDITWLERYARAPDADSKLKHGWDLKIVDYETAARNGEPMEAAIRQFGILPNPAARYCSSQLKPKAVRDYVDQHLDWGSVFQCFVGIRADEDRRARKMHNTIDDRQERFCPLWLDGITKKEVCEFWEFSDFDLDLPNNGGVTDWGNCDICFLKPASKKLSIIKARPDLADWWIRMEKLAENNEGNGRYFRIDHPSIEKMKLIASDGDLFGFGEEESISCFCGD